MIDYTEAHNDVSEMYKYLKDTASKLTTPYLTELNKIVNELSMGIDNYSNAQLRDYMMRLGVETFHIGNVKEQCELKEACANALYKEGLADSYNTAQGTNDARKNQALIDSLDKQAVNLLYTAVSSIFKTHCDEAHRLVSVINGILISRAADAKNMYSPRSEANEIDFDPTSMPNNI